MSINLRADNRSITKDGKYSYLNDNYPSYSSSLSISNSEGFGANSMVLVGNVGSENSEILQVQEVDTLTNTLTFKNFTATAIGSGLLSVIISNPGSGYLPGEILTVTQSGAFNGKVRVGTVDGGGAITSLTVDEPGYAYVLNTTTDETQNNTVDGSTQDWGETGPMGQSITLGATNVAASYLKVKLRKVGSPTDNVLCQITTMADKDTVLYTSDTIIAGTTITTSLVEYTFAFTNAILTAGTQYLFRFVRSGANSVPNYYMLASNMGVPGDYTGGSVWQNNGAWYQNTDYDIYFKLGAVTINTPALTTGGGNDDATIGITSLTTNTSATSILFDTSKDFIAGQPVEVFSSLGVSRGTGVVSTSGSGTTMALTAPGITGSTAGDSVVVGNVTRFAHAESTKVTVIQYDQVRFFRTNTPSVPNLVPVVTINTNQDKSITQTTTSTIGATRTTTYTQPNDPSSITTIDYTPPIVFTGAVALTVPLPIQVNDFYTTYFDSVNSDGYGWFSFYNSSTLLYSPISNPIPYSGFPQNTVKKVFETFDSSINTKELKLITQADRFNWLNEGLSYMTNELNVSNWEYLASEEVVLNIYAGVGNYLLPQDFSDLLFINDSLNNKMESYNATFERANVASSVKYAIRGRYLTFYPPHQQDTTVTLAYLKNAPVLSKLDDVVDLPNNAYYAIKDFMRYRAYQKLQNSSESANSFAFFKTQIDSMKIHALKRDDGLDSWSIDNSANV